MRDRTVRRQAAALLLLAALCALVMALCARVNAQVVREAPTRGAVALTQGAVMALAVEAGDAREVEVDLVGEAGARYAAAVLGMTGIDAAALDGQSLGGARRGLPLIGAQVEFDMPRGGARLTLTLRLPAGADAVYLGAPQALSALRFARMAAYVALLSYVLTMGLYVLLLCLTRQAGPEQGALGLVCLLLLLTQAGELLGQYPGAAALAGSSRATLAAALCCYAGLALGDGRETRPVAAALVAGVALTAATLLLLLASGRVLLQLPARALTVALCVYAGLIAWRGLARQARRNALGHAAAVAPLAVGAAWEAALGASGLAVPSLVLMGAGMTLVQQITLSREAAGDRREREALERELERRVDERTQALRQTEEQLRRIDRSRSEFFSRIAHDLQSPLTVIRGSLDLVAGGVPVTDEERDAYVDMAKQNALRMTNRVKALRGLALLDETPFAPQVGALSPLLEQCARAAEGVYRKSGVVFRAECEADLTARFDAGWLQNALDRLISNAVRYTPAGGAVTLGARREGYGVWVSVADEGCGIAPDEQEGIFDRFYQGWNSPEGFGIGLAVVQRVAQRHGGRAQVVSQPGEGATFGIFLPDEGELAPGGDAPDGAQRGRAR